jgi:hypothetical protein
MFDWFGNWQNVLGAAFLAPFAIGGVIIAIDTLRGPKEPSDADVQRAADRYREFYKDNALDAIGDHMLAATFAPTREHHRFLKRVCQELQRDL